MNTSYSSINCFPCLRAVAHFSTPSECDSFIEKVGRVAIAVITSIPALVADLILYLKMKIYYFTNLSNSEDQRLSLRHDPVHPFLLKEEIPVLAPSAPNALPPEHPEVSLAKNIDFLQKILEKAAGSTEAQSASFLKKLLDDSESRELKLKLAAEITLFSLLRTYHTLPSIPDYIDLDTSIHGISLRELAMQTLSLQKKFDEHAEALSRNPRFLATLSALRKRFL